MAPKVAAFGLKHKRLGEQLAVACVVAPGAAVTPAKVTEWCAQRLAKFKVPSMVFVRSQPLPRGGTGKVRVLPRLTRRRLTTARHTRLGCAQILKRELRAQYDDA